MEKKSSVRRYKKVRITFVDEVKRIKDKDVATVAFAHDGVSRVLVLPSGLKTLSIGIGKKKEINHRTFVLVCRKIIHLAREHRLKKIMVNFPDIRFPLLHLNDEEIAGVFVTNVEMANFEFIHYRSVPKEGWNFVEEVIITGAGSPSVRAGCRRGQIVGEEVNNCRTLANTPGGLMTPPILARKAKEAAKKSLVKVKVLGLKEIQKLKMGGVLGVAQGSVEEPKFIVMEYFPVKKKKPVVLIGKGVTFDSGGLSLKPAESMKGMHADMSGGAAVISTMMLAARLKIRKNIVGLIPAVENMPSGSSYRPGDILKTMSGKTIEVLNTDAEGRIILADALTYAKKYGPELVVDVATLTGAAVVALGQRVSAIFTRDEKLERHLRDLGEKSGDYVWPLPLWDEYEEDIKGTFGDICNTGKTRYGGAITGAVFLYQFAKDFPWVHIDIAPRTTTIDGEYLAKGASGAPVRLLIHLLESM